MRTTEKNLLSIYTYKTYIFLFFAICRLYGYGYGYGAIRVGDNKGDSGRRFG